MNLKFGKVCDLDNGHPERLTKTDVNGHVVLSGFPKLQAKRKGEELTIYTPTGKREYTIQGSW